MRPLVSGYHKRADLTYYQTGELVLPGKGVTKTNKQTSEQAIGAGGRDLKLRG